MRVYLLRHGIAEDGNIKGSDADRALTHEGRTKLREVLRTAAKAGVAPKLIISSPFVRAVQTAEIACDVLGFKEDFLRTDALIPSSEPRSVWEEVRVHKNADELMLVGHEPLLGKMVGYLLGTPALSVDLKKAGLVRIDIDGFGPQPRGVLKWMLVPKLV
jgi:phosphohistidine phosphatase